MISYEDLYSQNHKITELSNVLTILLKNRSVCDSETCSNLFYSYIDLVEQHIKEVDKNMYTSLLQHSSAEANKTANNFMSGSQETRRIMKKYARRWCDKKQRWISIGAKHDTFLQETDEMFSMILKRIQNEVEHLYPMVRKISA